MSVLLQRFGLRLFFSDAIVSYDAISSLEILPWWPVFIAQMSDSVLWPTGGRNSTPRSLCKRLMDSLKAETIHLCSGTKVVLIGYTVQDSPWASRLFSRTEL